MGDFPECLSQRILVGIILVGRLGVSNMSSCVSTSRSSAYRTLSVCSTASVLLHDIGLISISVTPARYTAIFKTKILDFRGFDSSIILSLRGGILRSTGNFPEMLSQQILSGIILVGRSGVVCCLMPFFKPRCCH